MFEGTQATDADYITQADRLENTRSWQAFMESSNSLEIPGSISSRVLQALKDASDLHELFFEEDNSELPPFLAQVLPSRIEDRVMEIDELLLSNGIPAFLVQRLLDERNSLTNSGLVVIE
jgi:hypothetical protein